MNGGNHGEWDARPFRLAPRRRAASVSGAHTLFRRDPQVGERDDPGEEGSSTGLVLAHLACRVAQRRLIRPGGHCGGVAVPVGDLNGQRLCLAERVELGCGGLAEDPSSALAHYTRALDAAWRHLAGGLTAHPDTVLGADGRLHAAKVTAVPDPPSLTDLRTHCQAMLPRVDLPELILEVMSWCPGFVDAFTAASGGQPRMADLHVTIAGALAAQSLNVGFTPIVSEVTPALSRDRLSHVDQNYLRPENYSAANAVLISAQADLAQAQRWGGGMVAAVDGMRFVVPVQCSPRAVSGWPGPRADPV